MTTASTALPSVRPLARPKSLPRVDGATRNASLPTEKRDHSAFLAAVAGLAALVTTHWIYGAEALPKLERLNEAAVRARSWEAAFAPNRAVAAFLATTYALHKREETDRALDHIFEWIDARMREGERGSTLVDMMLHSVDVSKLDEDLLVGLLSATFSASSLLAGREDFTRRARERLSPEIGAEAASSLVAMLSR